MQHHEPLKSGDLSFLVLAHQCESDFVDGSGILELGVEFVEGGRFVDRIAERVVDRIGSTVVRRRFGESSERDGRRLMRDRLETD